MTEPRMKLQATRILERSSKETVAITDHGEPSAYLADVQDYESMQRRVTLLEALSKGENAILDKRTIPHAQAKQRMGKWLR